MEILILYAHRTVSKAHVGSNPIIPTIISNSGGSSNVNKVLETELTQAFARPDESTSRSVGSLTAGGAIGKWAVCFALYLYVCTKLLVHCELLCVGLSAWYIVRARVLQLGAVYHHIWARSTAMCDAPQVLVFARNEYSHFCMYYSCAFMTVFFMRIYRQQVPVPDRSECYHRRTPGPFH